MNRFKKQIGRFLCFIGVILAAQAVYFYHIQSANPALEKSDIIAILPAAEDRIKAGYELGKLEYAPTLTIVGVSKAGQMADSRYRGFPSNVRRVFTDKSRSTFEDALNIKNLVNEHDFKSVTLVTSSYHMPRAYLLLKILLSGSGVRVERFGTTKDSAKGGSKGTHLFGGGRIVLVEMMKFWGSCFEMLTHKPIKAKSLKAK